MTEPFPPKMDVIAAALLIQYGDGRNRKGKGWFTIADLYYVLFNVTNMSVVKFRNRHLSAYLRKVVLDAGAEITVRRAGRSEYRMPKCLEAEYDVTS